MGREQTNEGTDETRICRGLEDGWDYQPDWRTRHVDAYLEQIAKAPDRKAALVEVVCSEKDPVVRQGLRHRMTGSCAATAAFAWAARCARDNTRTGVLSMLKAMVVAGLPTAAIASELGTTPFNVVIAERLHFDVRRYLQNRLWLRSTVIEPREERLSNPEQSRARMWMTVAFESGAERLLSVLRGGEDTSTETLETNAQRIEAITGRRALEFVRGLDRSGSVETEDDLKRFLLARSMRSREAATTASEQMTKIKDWGLALVRTLNEPNKASLDANTLQDAARMLPMAEMKELAVRQLEERQRVIHAEMKAFDEGAPAPALESVVCEPGTPLKSATV